MSTSYTGQSVDAQTAQRALAYACLILADDDVPITAENLMAIEGGRGFDRRLHAQSLRPSTGLDAAQELIQSPGALAGAGGGGGGAAVAAGGDSNATQGKIFCRNCFKSIFF